MQLRDRAKEFLKGNWKYLLDRALLVAAFTILYGQLQDIQDSVYDTSSNAALYDIRSELSSIESELESTHRTLTYK